MYDRDFWTQKRFSDNTKFPYGFSRSGDFTLKQSQLLEENGQFIIALLKNEVTNPSEEDIQLKDAILTGNKQYSELAKVWLKYNEMNRRKISVSSSTSKMDIAEVDDWEPDDPID
ncbi:DUF413 domain-containing protein [Aliikangiella sp. IMCC44359]|uniref:DUF413 domain-containing protein n=1 Tax=Aliikangiella sp. IMCC44359 TaxID=3459125 RepID=UPI00403A9BEC